jgi:Bacterial Ig-like domain (group 3)
MAFPENRPPGPCVWKWSLPVPGRRRGARRVFPVEILERRQLLATITVNTSADFDGTAGGDALSLRQAIELSDGTLSLAALGPSRAHLVVGGPSSPNTIDFDIPGTGPFTIAPTTGLPAITNSVVIDGYSQPGSRPNTNGPGLADNAIILVELSGINVAQGADGLTIQAGESTVQGLSINFFVNAYFAGSRGTGIVLNGGSNTIQGDFIGLDPNGSPGGFAFDGIDVEGPGNTIGGTAPGSRNVITASTVDGIFAGTSASGTLVEGNFVGTDTTGTVAVPNDHAGIHILSNSTTIGGTATGAGNLISGNSHIGIQPGLYIGGSFDLVEGNLIGTDLTGTRPLPNGGNGINVSGGQSVTIGGTASGAGNVISGNASVGLAIGLDFNNLNSSGSNDLVEGNLIGTNPTGTMSLPNLGGGVLVANSDSTTIGGTVAGSRNVISGNDDVGLHINSSSKSLVEGNFIGTDTTGSRPLPNGSGIDADGQVTIGGTATGAGNLVSGNAGDGIDATGGLTMGSGTLVEGNFIGTDVTGSTPLPNVGNGVAVTGTFSTIGGTTIGSGNLISGNAADGLTIDLESTSNLVVGNFIGTDPTGTTALPNGGDGIAILGGSSDTIGGTTAGAGNVIAFNQGNGVSVAVGFETHYGPSPPGSFFPTIPDGYMQDVGTGQFDTISGNSIFGNQGQGIDLLDAQDSYYKTFGSSADYSQVTQSSDDLAGGNSLLAAPTIQPQGANVAGSVISGSVSGLPSSSDTIEFFSDPSGLGQGRTYLGSVVASTDASGHAVFRFDTDEDLAGQHVTATVTDSQGDTSGFSGDATFPMAMATTPTTTTLVGPSVVSVFGQAVTFTASVAGSGSSVVPTGIVGFVENGVLLANVPVDASGHATFTTSQLLPGLQTIVAIYSSNLSPSFSVSNSVIVGVLPTLAFGGPTVTSTIASTLHSVTIFFSRSLMPGPASNTRNFSLIGPAGHSLTIVSAVYHPSRDSITLVTRQALKVGKTYRVRVKGVGVGSIADIYGIPLAGKPNHRPATNFSGTVKVKLLAHPHPHSPKKLVVHKKGR